MTSQIERMLNARASAGSRSACRRASESSAAWGGGYVKGVQITRCGQNIEYIYEEYSSRVGMAMHLISRVGLPR
eukprot:350048-Chlamydomonas_euryale.AAC.7